MKILWLAIGKNKYGQSGLRTLKVSVLAVSEIMELGDFVHAGTKSFKLKGDWKF